MSEFIWFDYYYYWELFRVAGGYGISRPIVLNYVKQW